VTDDDPLADVAKDAEAPLARAETKRLLYVALTRAKERVVLSGTIALSKGLEKQGNKARAVPTQPGYSWRALAECKSLAHYVVTCLRLAPNAATGRWAPHDANMTIGVDEVKVADLDARAREQAESSAAHVPLDFALASAPMGGAARRVRRDPFNASALGRSGEVPSFEVHAGAVSLMRPAAPNGFVHEEKGWEALLGDVFHGAAELWGLRGPRPSEAALRRLAGVHLATDDVDVRWVDEALAALEGSALGQEMIAAAERGELFHELPVEVVFPAREGAGHERLLRGRIDALFRDASGSWVVVDYKLTGKGPEEAVAEYASQLRTYREALTLAAIGPVGRVGLWLALTGTAVWLR
jgi:ATP-dependent exoDNAse (exonuclease V) beta subunit